MTTGFFEITPPAEALLFDLVRSEAEGLTLVIAPSGASILNQSCDRLVSKTVEEFLDGRVDLGTFDAAIVIPPFGVEVPSELTYDLPAPIRRWFAEEYLIARACSRLEPRGRLVAFASSGLLSLAQRKDARQFLISSGLRLVAQLPNEALYESDHAAPTHLLLLERGPAPDAIAVVDFADELEIPTANTLAACLGGSRVDMKVPIARVSVHELGNDARLDPAFHEPAYLALQPPPGFEEYRLGDLAEIIAGVKIDGEHRRTERRDGDIPYVQVRHLRSDDVAAHNPFWISPDVVAPHRAKLAQPGDILVSAGGTTGKVAQIGPEQLPGVLFDTSIRRVRITTSDVSARAVAEFLRSDLGQLQFRRLTTGTVIPHLTSAHLAQVRVFIATSPPARVSPPDQLSSPPTPPDLSEARLFAHTVQSELKALLAQVGEAERYDWRQPLAERLRKLTADLVPPTLPERVRQTFPAPLAIAFRRYHMARHNPYEQLDRMINLVEACVYFVFHVLVAEYSRADWRVRIELSRDARAALKPRADFADRIQFIRAVTALAREHRLELFVPRLLDTRLADHADEFRTSLRNPVAHSAPGSEAYVAGLVRQHVERLERMLGELDPLANYSLCRIRSHYFQRGRWHYQCEVYRGEEYDVNLEEIVLPASHANHLIAAERDHLVLLSPEYEALDLWPYYQLHFSEATCRESHLCFVKHFTAADRILHGESIRSGIELELDGFDDYLRSASTQGGSVSS